MTPLNFIPLVSHSHHRLQANQSSPKTPLSLLGIPAVFEACGKHTFSCKCATCPFKKKSSSYWYSVGSVVLYRCQLIEFLHLYRTPHTKLPSVHRWQPPSSKTFLTPSLVTIPQEAKKEPGWMNRKGNSRHNAYLSSLPLFLLPTPLWHPFFSSFLFCWQKLSDSSDSFHTGRWLDREFLQPRLKTKSNPKSSIFPVLIYFSLFFFKFYSYQTPCLSASFCKPWKPGFPFFTSCFSLSKTFAFTCQNISESKLIWRQRGDGLLLSSCLFFMQR